MNWDKAVQQFIVWLYVTACVFGMIKCTAGAAEPDDPVTCLAQNIYYEAANQPIAGQIAVAQVVVNRLADSHFPKTVCAVVYERRVINGKKVAAFSWTLGAAWRAPGPVDEKKYAQCRRIAIGVVDGIIRSVVVGPRVEYYHAAYIHPDWPGRRFVVRIGSHLFYQESHHG